MVVFETEEQMLDLIEKGVSRALRNQNDENIISGWKNVEAFMGIRHHQIKANYDNGLYKDALQISGRMVVLNKQRLWEVMANAK